jgi:molybdate transport system substrate-binding protein
MLMSRLLPTQVALRLLAIVLWTALPVSGTLAAELKVVSAGAVRGVLAGMITDYAKETGHTFTFTLGSTGQLRQVVSSGEPADLIIAASALMDEFETTGRMRPGIRVDLGAIGVGSVTRDGMTTADLSTTEGVRQAIIDAKSIAYTDPKLGGATYLHLLKIAERFGLVDAVKAKGVAATGGDDAAAKVAKGEADLAIVFLSEIQAGGAKLTAVLPDDLQLWAVYSAAIPASSREPEHAARFIAALTSPALRPRWAAAGWRKAD